jgi:hypothetical protein
MVSYYLQVAAMGVMAEAFALPVIAVLRREMAIDKAATVGIVGTTVLATVTIGCLHRVAAT